MPQIDREGFCLPSEYEDAHKDRLQASSLNVGDSEIMALYMRIKGNPDRAFMSPVHIEALNIDSRLGIAAASLAFLNPDFQKKFAMKGMMADGIWNPVAPNRIRISTGDRSTLMDGVFGPYEDGIDMDDLLKELVGASASRSVDLGSLHI